MQQIDTTISPNCLTDSELHRLAAHYITVGTLPRNWQMEVVYRFGDLLTKFEELTDKK